MEAQGTLDLGPIRKQQDLLTFYLHVNRAQFSLTHVQRLIGPAYRPNKQSNKVCVV